MRKAGILMPVASLPGPHGVGDFGKEAYRFVDMITEAGFKLWQILPLNPLGYGNSPYQAYSSRALDERYVSLEQLRDEGLLTELPESQRTDTIDYQSSQLIKREYLWKSYRRFNGAQDYTDFVSQKWVRDYAVFITFKEHNDNRCWVEWPDEFKNYPVTHENWLQEQFAETIRFHCYVQYQLYRQFNALKKYANEKGIEIMGDMPFYVGIDSDDVYYNRDYFLLYDDGRPEWIAGVPPDYFSATGQRWGNPLYDWDHLRRNKYDFWFERIADAAKIYDIVRIDHFRAFDTYWKIHSSEETAINGEWIVNSGHDFFRRFYRQYPDINIIAEDLGDLRPEVGKLRDDFNLMGMLVQEFNFFDETREHQICYIGTHDNESLRKWYRDMDPKEKYAVSRFICKKYPKIRGLDRFLQYCLDSRCEIAVLSVNDILHDTRRINLPGTIGSPNWEYKIAGFRGLYTRLKKIRGMIEAANR